MRRQFISRDFDRHIVRYVLRLHKPAVADPEMNQGSSGTSCLMTT